MFKVIIAGGRDYNNYPRMAAKMDKLLEEQHPCVTIISGGAKGADALGERYATQRGYPLITMVANWEKHGKRAGYLRNQDMLAITTATVCFWDGSSKGTTHMIDITRASGKPLRVIRYVKGA